MTTTASLNRTDAWADLLVVLSNCLRKPDQQLVASVRDGELQDVLTDAVDTAGLHEVAIDPPHVTSVGEITERTSRCFKR